MGRPHARVTAFAVLRDRTMTSRMLLAAGLSDAGAAAEIVRVGAYFIDGPGVTVETPSAQTAGGDELVSDDVMPAALVEAIRRVVNLIAAREWTLLSRVADRSRVDWPDVERVVDEYPHPLSMLPSDVRPHLDGVRADDGSWSIRCAFRTEAEGRSDLEVQATAREVVQGLWHIDVDDVLVP